MPNCIPEPGNTISTTRKCWEYTLTGFGDFLEQRSVAFSSEMPEGRICSMCDLVSPVSSVLPCGHILCEFCKGRAGRECPMDGKGFAAKGLKRLELTMSELDHMTVVCVRKNGQTCSFTGKISELQKHLVECGTGDVNCRRCGQPLRRNEAADHYRQRCKGGSTAFQNARVVRRSRGPIQDGEQSRDCSPEGQSSETDKGRCSILTGDATANHCNGSVENIDNVGRELSGEDVPTVKNPASWGLLPPRKSPAGYAPFRAASRPGLFVCTCVFVDVYKGYDWMVKENKEHTINTESYVLAGYTFILKCKFLKDEGDRVHMSLGMALRDGDWDGCVQWPFSRTVTLIVTHMGDVAKDVRLPLLTPEDCAAVRKPRPGATNAAFWAESKLWKDFELHGHVDDDAMYVTVELE